MRMARTSKKISFCSSSTPAPIRRNWTPPRRAWRQAKAAADLAKIQFDRYAELVGTKAISKQDYDTKKNTVDVDQAQIGSAEAAVETAKLNLEYCYIHSPIDGRAGARLVDVGNVVQAQHDLPAFDSAPRSDLRRFHHHRTRPSRSAKEM